MPDKVQQEIEELLDKLDNFIPEERFASKARSRRRRQRLASVLEPLRRLSASLPRISLGHVMLTGLALLLIGTFFGGRLGDTANWMIIAGLVLAGGSFVLSIAGGGRPAGGRRVEKRWRGQVIEYAEPSTANRLFGWLRGRRRR